MFQLSIDRPTNTARLHLADSKDSRCFPEQRVSADSYRRTVQKVSEARALADLHRMTFELCKLCQP